MCACHRQAINFDSLRGAPPLTIPRRIAIQHSKMFRFLNAYIQQICRFAPQSPLKIGTFSVGGGQKRRVGYIGEDALARSASPMPISLVTFLFGHKKVTPTVSSPN